MAYFILKTCETCNGDGTAEASSEPYGSVTCWRCGGSGKVQTHQIDDLDDHVADILAKCSDILNKCNDILEVVSE